MHSGDYRRLAAAFQAVKPEIWVGPRGGTDRWARMRMNQWESDVVAISAVLAKDNQRFDPKRFLAACLGDE